MWIRRALRVLLRNALGVVALLLVLLFVTALAGDVRNAVERLAPRSSPRAELPVYPDRERARQIFRDARLTVEEYEPYVVWTRLPLATEHVNIGEDGFRIHRAGRDADEGATPIGFFGGSSTWGTGVDDDSTIPAFFDRQTEGWAVANYAQGGHTARQNLALLANLIAERRAPLVAVFYNGFNHVRIHCNRAITERLNSHRLERRIRRSLTERPRGGYVFADVVSPTLDFFRRSFRKHFRRDDYVCHREPERAEQVAEVLLRIWQMADALMRAEGGRLYAFLQPVAYLGSPRLDHLELDDADLGRDLAAVYARVRAKLPRPGLEAADLSDAFDGDPAVYIDDVHVVAAGNEIIARRVRAHVR